MSDITSVSPWWNFISLEFFSCSRGFFFLPARRKPENEVNYWNKAVLVFALSREGIIPSAGCSCSLLLQSRSQTGQASEGIPRSLPAADVPPPAAHATILYHSLCLCLLHPPHPCPPSCCWSCHMHSARVRAALLTGVTVATLAPSRAEHPRASVTPAPHNTAVHGAPSETVRQDHASAHPPSLPLASPRHQACLSLRHGNTLCIIKDTFPKRLLAHYSATTVTCLDTQNVHFSPEECARPGSSSHAGNISRSKAIWSEAANKQTSTQSVTIYRLSLFHRMIFF